MVEITEDDILEMKKGFKAMNEKVSGLDFSKIASKDDVKLCIGAECEKLSGTISENKKALGGLKDQVDHIDELVHDQNKRFRAPSRETHAAARRAAQDQEKKHGHDDMKAMADCPDCYKLMREAVEPKLLAEGYRKEAVKLSAAAKARLKQRGIPHCEDCGVPWLGDDKGVVPDKCDNCGVDKDAEKQKSE